MIEFYCHIVELEDSYITGYNGAGFFLTVFKELLRPACLLYPLI
jgi:hypothetical protein